MAILFHAQVEAQIRHRKTLKSWLTQMTLDHHKSLGAINIIVLDDESLLRINRETLSHDYYTDIITFDFSSGKKVAGDLYISIDRIRENARKFAVSERTELHRVIAHGVLHLLGYKDKSKADQQVMRDAEDRYLQKLSELFHVEHIK